MGSKVTHLPDRTVEPTEPFPGAGRPEQAGTGKPQTERVMKMFSPADAIAVIKATTVNVTLGHGAEARQFVIRPLSPKQLLGAYKLIQELLVPLAQIFKPGQNVSLADLIGAVGVDNIGKLPELVKVILDRGNDPVSLDWINDNLDILLDLQLILPAFLQQNGLDKLFAPKGQ
jgi:hypothetical protein